MGRARKKGRSLHGILLLDKRLGVSSNRALQEVRRLFDAKKAGHTGTLDPLATGLLPVCFGEATKVSSYLLDDNKRYHTVIQLGATTDTADSEGQILTTAPIPTLTTEIIQQCLSAFLGEIEQIPPMYSALKHQGKKLYELARAGEVVERKPRKISIHQLDCLAFDEQSLTLEVSCSKGTYIRTLAEDIGKCLGCGAYVKQLRRTETGCFSLDSAYTLEQLQAITDDSQLLKCLQPFDVALPSLPKLEVPEIIAQRLLQGQRVLFPECIESGQVRLYAKQVFLGIVEVSAGKLIPKRIFNYQ